MKNREKDKSTESYGLKPISEGLKPTSGAKTPKAPKGGTSQSNKGKK